MKKTLIGLAIGLTISCSFVSYAGWTEIYTDQGVCEGYQNEDGTYKTNEWYQDEMGQYYYFGEDGALAVNTITPDGYYVDWEGVYVPAGTQSDRTGWYNYTHYKTRSNVSFITNEDSDIDGGTVWLEEGTDGGINAIFYDKDEIYQICHFVPRLDETFLCGTDNAINELSFNDDDSFTITVRTYFSGSSYMETEKTYTR